MQKILVPTDFSKEAENALKTAAIIAKKFDAEIYLLHMLDLPLNLIDPVQGNSQNVPEALYFMKLAHMHFSKIKESDYLKDLSVTEAVQFNHAFKGITEFAKNNNCDLIIMGSHGSSGFQEMFAGIPKKWFANLKSLFWSSKRKRKILKLKSSFWLPIPKLTIKKRY